MMFALRRKSPRLAMLVAAGVILFSIGASLWTVHLARGSQWWVEHTHQVIGEAREVRAAAVNAETGERGYLVTGDDAFLEPWTNAQAKAALGLAHLKDLTGDNPGQQLLLGQMEELVSRKFEIIAAVIAAHRQGLAGPPIDKKVMDRFRRVETEFEGTEQSLYRVRQGALETRWTVITLTSLAIGLGALTVLLLATRQIGASEARAAAAEVMAQRSQKMEAIGQLTGGIAHDFNNILQVVITNLDLAVRQLGPQQSVSALLQTAMMGLEKGGKLTSQLLAFARRQPLRPEAVAINKVLDETVLLLRRTLGERYEIEVVAAGGGWRAMIDPQLLVNAIVNLALNARDAMPDGGRLTLEVANVTLDADYAAREQEVEPGQYVLVAVSDTGQGMPREVQERVFEPFFTTKTDGTGLGLAMVFGFIKQSHGHIKIYSEPGEGTVVKMYLPRTTREEAVRAVVAEGVLRGDGQTILVLEDDDGVRAGVVAQLSDLGYKVVAASEGNQALEILRKDSGIDLLFTDIVLTGDLNGRAVADRARRFRPDLPVIYTSGYTENAIVHHGRLDEGAILLSKPYRASDLARVIKTALGGGGTPPAARSAAAAGPRMIVLAEDDPSVRVGMVMMLEGLGHRVIEAATGAAALAAIDGDSGTADLMIADLGLPDMDGLALAGAARTRLPGLEIVIASGSIPSADGIAGIPGPPPRCLLKPFSSKDLTAAIG